MRHSGHRVELSEEGLASSEHEDPGEHNLRMLGRKK
jgi:hypothetical protein